MACFRCRDMLFVYNTAYFLILLVSGLAVLTSAQLIVPINQTLSLGSNIVFNCSSLANDIITWYIYTPTQMKLFSAPNNSFNLAVSNPTKYVVSNLVIPSGVGYTLAINNLTLNDGNIVDCARSSQAFDASACIVVVASPVSMAYPNSTTGLIIGSNNVTLSCSVNYSAPTTGAGFGVYPVSVNQLPQLSMFWGSTNITNSTSGPIITQIPNMNANAYTLTLFSNYTPQLSDNGQILGCVVTTMSPAYSASAYSVININSPTTTLNITLNSTTIPPFTKIPCVANGYPPPMVTWNPVSPTTTQMASAVVSGPGLAILTPYIAGLQSWSCTATNQSTNVIIFTQSISFTVSGVPSNATAAGGGSNAVALGVGIGIGLGVPVLIALIVLIAVLIIWKRRRNQEKSVKAAQQKSATIPPKTDYQSAAAFAARAKAPNTGTGTPRASEVSVVQYPNNAYAFEQDENQPRVSPGYADLGVRHYSASVGGSVPVLNDSYTAGGVGNRSFVYDNNGRSSVQPPEDLPRQYVASVASDA